MKLHRSLLPCLCASVLCVVVGRVEGQNAELQPKYGSVELKTGYLPDPHEKAVLAGGTTRTRAGGVAAYIADTPSYKLNYQAGDKYALTIFVTSDSDTTLLVRMPNGKFVANDDAGGKFKLNPALHFENPVSGRYDIWVGTFSIGSRGARAKLCITERIAKKGTPVAKDVPRQEKHGTAVEVDNKSTQESPDVPNTLRKDQIPEAKGNLDKLRQSIDELAIKMAKMKAEAVRLQASIAAASATTEKVFRSAKELFASMPSDAYPKSGPEGGIERASTRKWLRETFTPTHPTIEFPITVKTVSIQGDGPYQVKVYPDVEYNDVKYNSYGMILDKRCSLAGQPCMLVLGGTIECVPTQEYIKNPRVCSGWNIGGGALAFEPCTEEEARLLRSMKGKTVQVRGVVGAARLWEVSSARTAPILFAVSCRQLSLDGFVPQAVFDANKKK